VPAPADDPSVRDARPPNAQLPADRFADPDPDPDPNFPALGGAQGYCAERPRPRRHGMRTRIHAWHVALAPHRLEDAFDTFFPGERKGSESILPRKPTPTLRGSLS
jgi:hypothetical protein